MLRAARWTALLAAAWLAVPAPPAGAVRPPVPERWRGGYLFAGIPWLAPADSALAMLAARGYVEQPGSRSRDAIHCAGKLFDRTALVTGMLDDQRRVIRWQITLPASSTGDPYVAQRRIYDDGVAEMEAKYGRRRLVQERFRFPYERGDGRQSQALREGYATVRSEWGAPGREHLAIELDRAVSVVFTYDSPWWTQAEAERRRKKAKDL